MCVVHICGCDEMPKNRNTHFSDDFNELNRKPVFRHHTSIGMSLHISKDNIIDFNRIQQNFSPLFSLCNKLHCEQHSVKSSCNDWHCLRFCHFYTHTVMLQFTYKTKNIFKCAASLHFDLSCVCYNIEIIRKKHTEKCILSMVGEVSRIFQM